MSARRQSAAAAAVILSVAWFATAAPARAALAVVGVNDTLAARHDRATVVAAPGVLGNDLNLLGGTTVSLTQDVSHGSVQLRSDGGYTYTPDPGYVGTDSFAYKPSGLLSTGARVNITVTNAAPVARGDAYATPYRTTLVVPAPGVLLNDTDADGDALVVELDGGGVSGSLSLDPNGAFTYTPGGGVSGTVSFRYVVSDGIASSAATATITVGAPPPTPTPTPIMTSTPTPTPTPRPSFPTPAPLPSLLPVPTNTLPSIPVPLPSVPLLSPDPSDGGIIPSLLPSATPGSADPSVPPGSADPSTARPVPTPSPAETAAASGGSAGSGSSGSGGGGRSGDGGSAAPVEVGPGGLGVRTTAGREGGFGDFAVRILGGLEVSQLWFVPAGILGGPGLLVILWVAIQVGAGLAWLPAARRLRGDEPDRVAIVRR